MDCELIRNFYGLSIINQIYILKLFEETSLKYGKQEIHKNLKLNFGRYLDTIIDLKNTKYYFDELTMNQKQCVLINSINELDKLLEYRLTNSDHRDEAKLKKYSNKWNYFDKCVRYYHPDQKTDDDVMNFLSEFNRMDRKERVELIYLFNGYYKDNAHFNNINELSCPDELLFDYDVFIYENLNDFYDYYSVLYPREKLAFINKINKYIKYYYNNKDKEPDIDKLSVIKLTAGDRIKEKYADLVEKEKDKAI